ncbi:20 kDa calcium-binding protein-like [Lineus longissimus]|uniref:20 kDa calcium-binding protein-like n=1 Tax=Lineus longissimus TaxID=88925 RepID=UPI002B4C8309
MNVEGFEVHEDKVKCATEAFKQFDKKGQGRISTNDLGPAFGELKLQVKGEKLKDWADMVDSEATGYIDLEGFLYVFGKKLKDDQDYKDLKEAFRVLDKNKTGEIDTSDLKWLMGKIADPDTTDEDIDDMIREVDTDGSGAVDFDEFYKLMTSE